MNMPRNIISAILLALLVLLHVAFGGAAHAGRPVDIGLASGALSEAGMPLPSCVVKGQISPCRACELCAAA